MIRLVLSLFLALAVLTLTLGQAANSKQYGPRIVVRKDGKVQVGPVKVDPVPPGPRIIERVIKGEPVDKAISNEVNSRVDEAKSQASAPIIQTEIEDAFFDRLRKIIGNDATDVVEVLNLPNQIARATPAALAEMLSAPKRADEVLKRLAGTPLLAALIQAKDYYKDKGKPIPNTVKILLVKSFSPETLNNARYVVDDFGGNIPAIINKIQETFGDVHAVAIDNIIVFSSQPKDEDIYFWAHELQHTVQYARMGMEKFAGEYTANYKSLEDDANDVAAEAEKKAAEILEFMRSLAALEK